MTGSLGPLLQPPPPLLSPPCFSPLYMDDFPGGPPPQTKVGPHHNIASPDGGGMRRLTPMSFYGSPGTSTNPDAGSQHQSPNLEQTWSLPPNNSPGMSTILHNNNQAPAHHQHTSSSDYHEPQGQYTELLPANIANPILGGEWPPQSPSDPLLIPTTFSLACSLPALSPSYDTLTPSTPHLVASFLGTGQVSAQQQPNLSVPVEQTNRQFGCWHLQQQQPGPSSSSTLDTQRWLDVQPTSSSVDPADWTITTTSVGCVSPAGAEVWQGLSSSAPASVFAPHPTAPVVDSRRRSTSRSPLNDTISASRVDTTRTRRSARLLRSPKTRTRIPPPDARLAGIGGGQRWAHESSSGEVCSVLDMEEEEAQNDSRDESLLNIESVNNSKSEITSVNTNIEKVCQDLPKQTVQVPLGK